MTKAGFCKICSYFKHAKWNLPLFEKEVAEGKSLRALRMLLLGMGLKVSEKTISSHFTHMDTQVIAVRKHKTSLKQKVRKKLNAVPKFFIKTPKLPSTSDCEHKMIRYRFDEWTNGMVWVICRNCGAKIREFDPEREAHNPYADRLIYASLTRRKRK